MSKTTFEFFLNRDDRVSLRPEARRFWKQEVYSHVSILVERGTRLNGSSFTPFFPVSDIKSRRYFSSDPLLGSPSPVESSVLALSGSRPLHLSFSPLSTVLTSRFELYLFLSLPVDPTLFTP